MMIRIVIDVILIVLMLFSLGMYRLIVKELAIYSELMGETIKYINRMDWLVRDFESVVSRAEDLEDE